MIKKIISIIFLVLLITSCDILMSFWVSPVFNIPAFRAAWTVDCTLPNNRIIGDSDYYYDDNTSVEWQVDWDGANVLKFYDYNNGDYKYITPLNGLPLELNQYDRVTNPYFYFTLLFKDDIGGVGWDLSTGGAIATQTIYLNSDGNDDIMVDYSMSAGAPILTSPYTLPEPAYLGIAGSGSTTELNGGLNILTINISAPSNDFVNGQAICVFSNTDPAGLLYMVYYHSSGLISLIYANSITRTGLLNYFPDGYYEYIWSVYRK